MNITVLPTAWLQPAFHALQWQEGKGEIEHGDRNEAFEEDRYTELVAPFVALWEAEKALHEEVKRTPQQERITEINARISVIEQEEQPRCLREAALGPEIVGKTLIFMRKTNLLR